VSDQETARREVEALPGWTIDDPGLSISFDGGAGTIPPTRTETVSRAAVLAILDRLAAQPSELDRLDAERLAHAIVRDAHPELPFEKLWAHEPTREDARFKATNLARRYATLEGAKPAEPDPRMTRVAALLGFLAGAAFAGIIAYCDRAMRRG
jgi:hypothetical protein